MCKSRYEVTILSAVDELQRTYKALNAKYFGNKLEKVIITIQTDSSRSAYAWISVSPVWSDKDQRSYREINIVAEWLSRDPTEIVASLLHEMCHLYNLQQGIQDCSRAGTYHNSHFRDCAQAHGLNVDKTDRYGWAKTSPTDELRAWVSSNCRHGCFRFCRQATYRNGKPKIATTGADGLPTTTSRNTNNIRRYYCPICNLVIRASRDLSGKLLCIDCSEVLVQG